MPSEPQPLEEGPTEQQIEQQLARFGKHRSIMGGDLRIAALRWLIDFQRRGMYDRQRNPDLASKQIYAAFYEYSVHRKLSAEVSKKGKTAEEIEETIGDRVKKLFGDLARALDDYYRGPGVNDPVKIELQCGQGGRYEPIIELRSETAVPTPRQAPELSNGDDRPAVGNPPSPEGGVTIYPNWDRFDELLDTVTRDESQAEDLRIITIGFKGGAAPEDKLVELATRGLRITVLITDPDKGEGLIRMRNRIRYLYDRETADLALAAITSQIGRLQERKEQVEELKEKQGCKGELDFYLSDLMPYAFVAHSSTFVVLGLFLATASYGSGPMIVVEASTNHYLWETLRNEWNERLKHATGNVPERAHVAPETARLPIINDAHLIAVIEAGTPDGADIWIAAPDLSNVGDATSDFSKLVRTVVRENANRGINYTYLCPHGWAGHLRLERLEECFIGTPGKLHVHEVPVERFLEITLVPSHFISFDPAAERASAYMQLPLPQSQKGWIALGRKDSARVISKMRQLIAEYPAAD